MNELEESKMKYVERMNRDYFTLVDRIMTLSTGALALSITFRTSFSPVNPNEIWLLKLSWIAFAITIVSGLAVHLGQVIVNKTLARIFGLEITPKGATVYLPWWSTIAKWINQWPLLQQSRR